GDERLIRCNCNLAPTLSNTLFLLCTRARVAQKALILYTLHLNSKPNTFQNKNSGFLKHFLSACYTIVLLLPFLGARLDAHELVAVGGVG
ncbi:hypothetical protein ACJX0J_035728, partial [Zea mays]